MDGGEEGWEGEVKGGGGRAPGEISTGIKAKVWNCVQLVFPHFEECKTNGDEGLTSRRKDHRASQPEVPEPLKSLGYMFPDFALPLQPSSGFQGSAVGTFLSHGQAGTPHTDTLDEGAYYLFGEFGVKNKRLLPSQHSGILSV